MRAAGARPTENDSPWPSAPAAFSTPGVVPSSGWPWRRLFSLRNVSSSSTGKNPRSARAAYQTGQAWPLLRTNRSRSGHVGFFGSTRRMWKYSAVTMSQADIEPPGWPLCTLCVMRMMCFRRVTAFFLRPAINSSETSTMAHPAPDCGLGRPGDDATDLRALVRHLGSACAAPRIECGPEREEQHERDPHHSENERNGFGREGRDDREEHQQDEGHQSPPSEEYPFEYPAVEPTRRVRHVPTRSPTDIHFQKIKSIDVRAVLRPYHNSYIAGVLVRCRIEDDANATKSAHRQRPRDVLIAH